MGSVLASIVHCLRHEKFEIISTLRLCVSSQLLVHKDIASAWLMRKASGNYTETCLTRELLPWLRNVWSLQPSSHWTRPPDEPCSNLTSFTRLYSRPTSRSELIVDVSWLKLLTMRTLFHGTSASLTLTAIQRIPRQVWSQCRVCGPEY